MNWQIIKSNKNHSMFCFRAKLFFLLFFLNHPFPNAFLFYLFLSVGDCPLTQTQSVPTVCKREWSSNVTKTKGKVVEVGKSFLYFGWRDSCWNGTALQGLLRVDCWLNGTAKRWEGRVVMLTTHSQWISGMWPPKNCLDFYIAGLEDHTRKATSRFLKQDTS